jgi:hypothetical protein
MDYFRVADPGVSAIDSHKRLRSSRLLVSDISHGFGSRGFTRIEQYHESSTDKTSKNVASQSWK